tara:strand:+ start:257 stop:484 length:228 start_codon:yes stop_codon:yes gene_type:complete
MVLDYSSTGGELRMMSKQEILERIQNVLNQGVDTESQDLDLLRHDLENDIIQGKSITDEVEERMLRRIQFNRECG